MRRVLVAAANSVLEPWPATRQFLALERKADGSLGPVHLEQPEKAEQLGQTPGKIAGAATNLANQATHRPQPLLESQQAAAGLLGASALSSGFGAPTQSSLLGPAIRGAATKLGVPSRMAGLDMTALGPLAVKPQWTGPRADMPLRVLKAKPVFGGFVLGLIAAACAVFGFGLWGTRSAAPGQPQGSAPQALQAPPQTQVAVNSAWARANTVQQHNATALEHAASGAGAVPGLPPAVPQTMPLPAPVPLTAQRPPLGGSTQERNLGMPVLPGAVVLNSHMGSMGPEGQGASTESAAFARATLQARTTTLAQAQAHYRQVLASLSSGQVVELTGTADMAQMQTGAAEGQPVYTVIITRDPAGGVQVRLSRYTPAPG